MIRPRKGSKGWLLLAACVAVLASGGCADPDLDLPDEPAELSGTASPPAVRKPVPRPSPRSASAEPGEADRDEGDQAGTEDADREDGGNGSRSDGDRDSGDGQGSGRGSRAGGDCAAYQDSAGWCTDGAGDYDCEGGTGNGPNYAPRGVRVVVPGVDPFGLDHDHDGEACEESRPAPPPPPPPPGGGDTDPRFGTCAEAKAAGYGPYRRGQDPEYEWYRDQDKDGVVCE